MTEYMNIYRNGKVVGRIEREYAADLQDSMKKSSDYKIGRRSHEGKKKTGLEKILPNLRNGHINAKVRQGRS